MSFNPDHDIPDLSGKVILVTGGNIGLGKESILQLSKHNPSVIYLAARNAGKAQQAIADIKKAVPSANVEFLELDLTSFKSVKAAADTFSRSSSRLDILMNNAGIMACPAALTHEGYEVQFGTNHMGHALLTKLLLPTLEKTAQEPGADVRIVNLSSSAHTNAPPAGLVLDDVKSEMKKYTPWTRYGQSKLANIFYTQQLAKRYPAIKSIAIHPGVVNTNLSSGLKQSYPYFAFAMPFLAIFFTVGVSQGAQNQLWASVSPDAKSGRFYYPVAKEFVGGKQVNDEKLSASLWDFTEKELKEYGY